MRRGFGREPRRPLNTQKASEAANAAAVENPVRRPHATVPAVVRAPRGTSGSIEWRSPEPVFGNDPEPRSLLGSRDLGP